MNQIEQEMPTLETAYEVVDTYKNELQGAQLDTSKDSIIVQNLKIILAPLCSVQAPNHIIDYQKKLSQQYIFLIYTLWKNADLSIKEIDSATPGELNDLRQRLDTLVAHSIVTRKFNSSADPNRLTAHYSLTIPPLKK